MQTATPGRADPLVGRSLEGRYRILERIARGGMSTVYAAVDERLDRLVAVKVMSAALSADPNFSDRFAREARAAARLTHMNVVSVYDQGQDRAPDGHHVFLVMELVEGRTLRELLRERGRLDAASAVSVMEPVLSALSAAHRAGLVHRDVKPENILLSDDGVVKVADFGLARAVETDAESTRTGLMMGTVAYCAPEQISRGVADPRSDVYSAGIVLFELLTGQPPYRGESAMNVAYQHVHSRVPAPSSKVRGLPDELDEIVVAATDSDPAGRPADAGAFLAELADLRSHLSLPVMPIPPRERPRGRSARSEPREQRRTPDAATTDLIRSGASAGGRHDTTVVPGTGPEGRNGSARRAPGRPPQRDENVPPPPVVIPPPKTRSPKARRRRRALIIVLILLLLGGAAVGGGLWLSGHYFKHVPRVTGKSRVAAVSALREAGYKVAVDPGPVTSETIPSGSVAEVDPSAGTRLTTGQTVTITLSKGPQLYQLPNVARMTESQARATLAAIGPISVASRVSPENSNTVAKNLITRTSPKAGTMITRRQTVTIWISLGRPVVDVPTIDSGTSVDDATDTLDKAGFPIDTGTEQYSTDVAKGTIISCNPTGKATQGTTVTCVVSKGPQFVTVPDISVGTPYSEAAQTLRQAGLVPERVSAGSSDGAVIATSPGGGKSVRIGTTVSVFVVG